MTTLGTTLVRLSVALFCFAPPASAVAQTAPRTIVFLGDSLTSGYDLPRDEAFPARVAESIQKSDLKTTWKVVNAGVSGDTSAGGVARLDWAFKARPDVLFVCLGINDGLRGLKIKDTEKNLSEILSRSLDRGVKIVLGGMYLPRNYGADYRRDFSEMYARLAKKHAVPFLPFLLEGVALREKYTLADGAHPNAEGARLMAANVWKALEPTLRSFEGDQGPKPSK